MNRIGGLAFVVFVIGAMLTGAGVVLAQSTIEARVALQLDRFQDGDWNVREAAFYELLRIAIPPDTRSGQMRVDVTKFLKEHPGQKDPLVSGLSALLQKELAIDRNAAVGSLSEEFMNYLGDLVNATASLEDSRTLDALVPALPTGNMASRAVASFGPRSVDKVVSLLDSSYIGDRIAATRTLGNMLEPSIAVIDSPTRARVKAALIRAARDSHFTVRDSAVFGLAKLPESDVTALLKEMSQRDPYSHQNEETGATVFPVRQSAARALEKR